MPNASIVKFNEIDQSFQVDAILQGLAAVLVRTVRGPFGHDGEITTSWEEFVLKYGGETPAFNGPTLIKRAFARGAKLRINKMGHYATISDPDTLDAVKGTIDETGADFAIFNDGMEDHDLFNLVLKYPGADYNNLTISITAASNGDTNSFNIEITHALEPRLNELYENLTIVGQPTVAESNYLMVIQEQSKLVDVVYEDLSSLEDDLRPINGTWGITGGTDGTAPTDADYEGDSAGKTGVFAFDDYDDFDFIASLDNSSADVLTAVGTYAKNREDVRALLYLPDSMTTTALLIAGRVATTLDTRYAGFFAGGLKIRNPFLDTKVPYNIPAIGDILGVACKSSAEFGPWWSFAGTQRGVINNARGVINNFVDQTKLNALAQKQINAVINKSGQIYVKGQLSAQLASSRKSYLNVVGLIIYLRKSLKPIFERYLEQPNDFRTFKEIYNEVYPFLEELKSAEKRAIVEYSYQGDQFANSDADLKVNTRPELDQGKYRVDLHLKEVVSLQEFNFNIISTSSSVSFEDNVN